MSTPRPVMLFGGDDPYDKSGGWLDFRGGYESVDAAIAELAALGADTGGAEKRKLKSNYAVQLLGTTKATAPTVVFTLTEMLALWRWVRMEPLTIGPRVGDSTSAPIPSLGWEFSTSPSQVVTPCHSVHTTLALPARMSLTSPRARGSTICSGAPGAGSVPLLPTSRLWRQTPPGHTIT